MNKQLFNLQETSLVTKVIMGVGSILVLAVAVSTMISFHHSEQLLMEHASSSMLKSLQVSSEDMEASLDEVAKDAQLISSGAGVVHLIKARGNRETDFEQDPEYLAWQSNLERMFATMIRTKGYLQVRFIGLADGGRELVRADAPKEKGQPVVLLRGKQLQQKGHRDYVQVGPRLQPDQIYISSINLNREQGKIQEPWTPTQRFVSPVYIEPETASASGESKPEPEMVGVIVINTNASEVIMDLVNESPFDLILVNDQGGILHHSDQSLCWKFEIDSTEVIANTEPLAWKMLLNKTKGVDMNEAHGHAHAVAQIPLGDTGDQFLGIIQAPSRDEILAASYHLKRNIASTGTISMLVALFISLFLVKYLLSPIKHLTTQAELVTAGQIQEIQPSQLKDEVGRLGQSFANLVTQLQHRQKEAHRKADEVLELNRSLEDKVAQRTAALEHDAATRQALNTALGLSLYAKTPEELMSEALDSLLDLEFLAIEKQGAAFIVEGNSRELTMVAEQNLAKPLKTLCAKVPFGKCYCGKAAEEKTLLFKSCVDEDHVITFDGMGPHGHYNVPLIDGPDVVGLLVLYLPHGATQNKDDETFLVNYSDILAGALKRLNIEQDLIKAQQEAEAANQSKSAFLANMSHEIRTPMTAILGYTDILDESDLPEKERVDHVHTIRQNGNHLLTIINDILDVSKIESGKMEIENIPVSLWVIVAEVQDLLSVKARDRGDQLVANFQYPLPEKVYSDPVRLRQILLNLVGNSIKFTENGEVSINISLVDGRLQMAVSDTGIGMTPEQAQKLFKPFSQADSSTTRKFGGTGLGLTISKYLSEAMGGDIVLESVFNQGSTFTVTIDPGDLSKTTMVNEQPNKSSKNENAVQADSDTLATGRILLAEDTLVNQKLAVRMLTKAGHTVDTADNGKEALDMALEQWRAGTPYEVILMDMLMPVMDGYESTRQLRAAEYALPIVALTANAMASDRDKCLDAGCDDFATKPFKKTKLLLTISSWVEKSRSLTV